MRISSLKAPRLVITALAVLVLLLAALALLTPFVAGEHPEARLGILLGLAGAAEIVHGVRRSDVGARRRALTGGVITLVMAVLLSNAPYLISRALIYLLAASFAADAVRNVATLIRSTERRARGLAALEGVANVAITLLLLFAGEKATAWVVAISSALHMVGIASSIGLSPVYTSDDAGNTVLDDLGLAEHPEMAELGERIEAQERTRAAIDRGWTLAFLATLFAIHLNRMATDGSLLGLIAPAVAVLGDMLIAVIVTYAVIVPLLLLWRKATRWIERRLWRWYLPAWDRRRRILYRLTGWWLRYRLRLAVHMRAARYSIRIALKRGLATGLPIAAIIAATAPNWGMTWYFDTENWAAGMWNSWAESRTDVWREAMARAVIAQNQPGSSIFAVHPPAAASDDFSFIVIGDPGEGDASQHALRDQVLAVATREDVKFVVISSDVVYPTGSMSDYEANFWLPLKGVDKPVYAIPGNHDWYDALEAFLATFLQPEAARTSMRARARADLRLTSTTDRRIEYLIGEAQRLRREYGVPTGFQQAPFFEIQTDRFALLALDTGIARDVDPAQSEWLEAALERSRGKTTMAILGHPFYAGGHDLTIDNPKFAALKNLLSAHGVAIVMAGDTHDLEYYEEPRATGSAMHHFVNGGGGAYLSFGTALAWPEQVPAHRWAFYPNKEAVSRKIDAQTPWWKRPAWWWTRSYGAWPFSTEWLSGLFDYNVAPFYQSFVEVRVEASSARVRVIPHGTRGPLRWKDLQVSRVEGPPDGTAEWVIPMAGDR